MKRREMAGLLLSGIPILDQDLQATWEISRQIIKDCSRIEKNARAVREILRRRNGRWNTEAAN